MPAYFEQGFMVREPAWHGMGTVLEDYPGREEAMKLAGHDFVVVEKAVSVEGVSYDRYKALVKQARGEDPRGGTVLDIARDTRGYVQPDLAWDVVDAFVESGAKYETALTLKDGAVLSVLAWLDEPAKIEGDDSTILPWINVSWSYDGSIPFSARPTSIRTVCWNTQTAAEAQGRRYDMEFVFKQTKHVAERVAEAKEALAGLRTAQAEYLELARELATVPVTKSQRELFVSEFIPMPPEAIISDRVVENVETARKALRDLFDGKTVPDAHRLTAYGLHLAGGEYLDHLRGYRNQDTYFGRSMLRREPAKAKMTKLIREVSKA